VKQEVNRQQWPKETNQKTTGKQEKLEGVVKIQDISLREHQNKTQRMMIQSPSIYD